MLLISFNKSLVISFEPFPIYIFFLSKTILIEFLNENKVGALQTLEKQPVFNAPPTDPEQIDPEAYGWVSWAYETLKRGDKHEALKMLERGLSKQKELIK